MSAPVPVDHPVLTAGSSLDDIAASASGCDLCPLSRG